MQTDEHISAAVPTFLEFHVADYSAHSAGPSRQPVTSPVQMFSYAVLKRCLDVWLVVLFSPFWLPLCTAIAIAVLLSSPGPIFFSHRRIGQGGTFFSMWKFRTMCENSAEVLERHLAAHPEDRAEWKRNHKLKNDPRITPVGRFLRRNSLDELPQLWNVLNGTMSLVGPRPIVAAEAEKYGDDFAYYLAVTPGITGLWQTSGRSSLSYDDRVALDRRYVESWSVTRDVRILSRTVTKVVNADGAY
jgi:Undecaprenyl-phosphate galactose phosphotransferase WbaP